MRDDQSLPGKPVGIPASVLAKYDEALMRMEQLNTRIKASSESLSDVDRARQENDARLQRESQGL